jgi:hypothetical protein
MSVGGEANERWRQFFLIGLFPRLPFEWRIEPIMRILGQLIDFSWHSIAVVSTV